MKKYLVVLLTFLSPFVHNPTKACDSLNLDQVRSFATDLSNDNVDYQSLIDEYLCTERNLNSAAQREKTSLLEVQLTDLRKHLRKNSWTIKEYEDIPLEEQNIQIAAEEKSNIYVIRFHGVDIPSCYIWIKNKKIVSFATMKKSNIRFFLKICS